MLSSVVKRGLEASDYNHTRASLWLSRRQLSNSCQFTLYFTIHRTMKRCKSLFSWCRIPNSLLHNMGAKQCPQFSKDMNKLGSYHSPGYMTLLFIEAFSIAGLSIASVFMNWNSREVLKDAWPLLGMNGRFLHILIDVVKMYGIIFACCHLWLCLINHSTYMEGRRSGAIPWTRGSWAA